MPDLPSIAPSRARAALEDAARALRRRDLAARDRATAKATLAAAKEVDAMQRGLSAYQRAGDELDRAELRYQSIRELLETLTGLPIDTLLGADAASPIHS